MKWLVTILPVVVGIVGFAYVKNVDSSREALRAMAEARKALQHCETTKRKAALEAAAPTFRNGTLRMIATAPAPTFQDDAQHMITVDARPTSISGPRSGASAKSQGGNVGLKLRDLGKPLRCSVRAYSRR